MTERTSNAAASDHGTTSVRVAEPAGSGRFSSAWAEGFARQAFAIEGSAEALGGYVDHNFRIAADDGRQYVLKLSAEDIQRLEIQNLAMRELNASPQGIEGAEIPRPIPAVDGRDVIEVEKDGEQYAARMLSFIEGVPLRQVRYLSPPLLRKLGALAANTVKALARVGDLDAASEWDIREARSMMEAALPHVTDERRHDAERVLRTAESEVAPLRASLREAVIHGDLTDENVIIEWGEYGRPRVRGVIDFADMCRSWLVGELVAMAVSYFGRVPEISTLVEIVRGFHLSLPLRDEEVDAILPLIRMRAAVCALETAKCAALDPRNQHLAAAAPFEWGIFEAVRDVAPIAGPAIRQACGREPVPALQRALAARARAGAAPIVDGVDANTPLVDLSPRSESVAEGAWRDPSAISQAIARIGNGGPVVGRYGEHRIIHAAGSEADPPAALHLGVDIFAEPGTEVRTPLAGTVARSRDAEVVLGCGGLFVHVRGIAPRVSPGQQVEVGSAIGTIHTPAPLALLPAHVHVQCSTEDVDALPGVASAGELWLSLCPDPSPLLGLSAEAPKEDPRTVLERRRDAVASPQKHYYVSPPEIVRGWRQLLYDSHARAYLDVVNNVAVLGHSHPKVTEAAARQFRQLNTNTRFLYRSMARFADALLEVVPDPLDVVFLVNSGSEANDLALQLARHATGRSEILAFEGAYHGWTGDTAELSSRVRTSPGGPSALRARTVPQPNPFRDRLGPDALPSYTARVHDAIAASRAEGGGPAGFICEPFVGAAGGVELPQGYLEDVYSAVRAAGGLCIADEVQTGYGRLGEHFWAFEQQGCVPDVITVAKCCGNGHPVAAVITRRAIADEFGADTSWFSSVGGAPVSCEVGLAVLKTFRAEGLQENARTVGEYFKARLDELVESHSLCGAVHGMGLYLGLELVRDRETLEPAAEEALAICERMLSLGVIVQPTGHFDNVLKLKPPLVFTRQDADVVADRLDRVFSEGWL